MVAKVISGQDIKGALNYNEQKVLLGTAECIQASGYLKDVHQLNFYDKLKQFTSLRERNTRSKTNTLHVSLNFDASEKISIGELSKIASAYMEKIGFGNQPFLVYEHRDAAHPHVHIVSTLIQPSGKRIPIHNLGKNQSETARKEIEIEFGLVRAQGKANQLREVIKPADLQKVTYGKSETMRSISNVVRAVTRSYKFASLPELNAVLRQYNVTADRGSEKSAMFTRNGLVYCFLDEKGRRIGVPIKASSIYGKPTLKFLEKQYALNDALRQPHKEHLKKIIDNAISSPLINTKDQFKDALHSQGIDVLYRINAEGRTYGVTFVDNKNRVVFNGSTLGKPYSANAIIDRLIAEKKEIMHRPTTPEFGEKNLHQRQVSPTEPEDQFLKPITEIVQGVITAETFDATSPEAALKLNQKRKRRRKKF